MFIDSITVTMTCCMKSNFCRSCLPNCSPISLYGCRANQPMDLMLRHFNWMSFPEELLNSGSTRGVSVLIPQSMEELVGSANNSFIVLTCSRSVVPTALGGLDGVGDGVWTVSTDMLVGRGRAATLVGVNGVITISAGRVGGVVGGLVSSMVDKKEFGFFTS